MTKDNEPLESQVDRLAKFILENIPGEPSVNAGAIDTAIRLLKAWQPNAPEFEQLKRKLETAQLALEEIKENVEIDLETAGFGWANSDRMHISAPLEGMAQKFGLEKKNPELETFIDHVLEITK